jgi:hypothetical protein
MVMSEYTYLGDRHSDSRLKGRYCDAVRQTDGKCVRGRNGNMLVEFNGRRTVVVARLLRKNKKRPDK